MRTVGAVLKNTRVEKGLSLKDVETATKIKEKVLSKIEEDCFSEFTSIAHAQGLVRNYAEFLGQDPDYLVALLRRQVTNPNIDKTPYFKLPNLSPFIRMPILTILVLLGVFIYLVFQLVNLRTGPNLEIFQPQSGAVVNFPKIQIIGKTEPEAQVTVNGQKISTNVSGEFQVEYTLEKGLNQIEIVAKRGQSAESRIVRSVEFIE